MPRPKLPEMLREDPLVITGIGAVSAAGDSVGALWDAALAGRSGAGWSSFERGAGAEALRFAVCRAPDLDMTAPDFRPLRKLDRSAQLAAHAASQAWREAGMEGAYAPERVGIMVGSSRGPLGKRNEGWSVSDLRRPPPSLAVDSTFGSLSGVIAQIFKLKGPGASASATCASSGFSIAFAAQQIVLGEADAMLVGGAEAPLHLLILEQMQSAGVLGSHEVAALTCRPFDEARNGLVLGEGSGFMVLETERTARARGAVPLARLTGWGVAMEDSGRANVDKDGAGLTRVMERALEIAGLNVSDIGYLNAHGTGTRLNDAAEARAILGMFGAGKATALCSSTKPVTGHCLGATSALEAILCVEALRNQMAPPTLQAPRAEMLLPADIHPVEARRAKIPAAMTNSLGFWGYHASLIFSAAVEPSLS